MSPRIITSFCLRFAATFTLMFALIWLMATYPLVLMVGCLSFLVMQVFNLMPVEQNNDKAVANDENDKIDKSETGTVAHSTNQ